MPEERPPLWPIVAIPAAITLAVTLLRLTGELLHWSPRLFSRDAGGGAALVGIAWLVPAFAIWFAIRLRRLGVARPRLGRAFALTVAAFAVVPVLGALAFPLGLGPLGQVALICAACLGSIAVGRLAWPALARVLLAYGLTARLPVVVVMLFAMLGRWDSHYALPRPDFPAMDPLPLWVLTGLMPQLTVWIAYTLVCGMLFGLVAAAVIRDAASA